MSQRDMTTRDADAMTEHQRIEFALGEAQAIKTTLLAFLEVIPDLPAFSAALQRNAEIATANNLHAHISPEWLEGYDQIVQSMNRFAAYLQDRRMAP